MRTLVIILAVCLTACGDVDPIVDGDSGVVVIEQDGSTSVAPYCGDRTCDEEEGEDYWNCIDCVDPLTGGPKHGYCGDGVCFNETMWSCWKDCRPVAINPGRDGDDFPWPTPPGPIPGPDPGPKPGPIPGPDPGPVDNLNRKTGCHEKGMASAHHQRMLVK